MVRRLATQVPASVSRMLQSTFLRKPPTWYASVLSNPPPVLPPRGVSPRARPGAGKVFGDVPGEHVDERREGHTRTHHMKQYREPKLRPVAITYAADRVRRQFFADFPFEALRPISLVEGQTVQPEHHVQGSEWTELSQRGRYPSVEDTVAFTLNLHDHHGVSLSDAYAQATSEFVALRAAHEMATLAAAAEGRHYGATFMRDEWTRVFDKETIALDESASANAPIMKARQSLRYKKPKIWTATINPAGIPGGDFTGGRSYAARWRMPAPVEGGAAAGDLVAAIGAAAGSAAEGGAEVGAGADVVVEGVETKVEETTGEMDDLDLMAAILGTPK